MKIIAWYLSLFFLILINCSTTNDSYTIELIDGKKITRNITPKWGDKPKLHLEFIREIGGLDSDDENYAFFVPKDLVKDSRNNIYILDAGNYRIQKFDEQWDYLSTIGRRGWGPAEFSSPVRMIIDTDENLYVADNSKIIVSILNKEGKEIKSLRLKQEVLGSFQLTSTKNLVLPNPGENTLVQIKNAEGDLIREFGEPKEYDDKKFNVRGNAISMVLDNRDNIYVTFTYQNRIEGYSSDGELIFSSDRHVDYDISTSMVFKEKLIKGAVLMMPEINKVSQAIAVDDKKRIWVVTYKRRETDEELVVISFPGAEREGFLSTIQRFGNTELKITDLFEFEIFDENGILLQKIDINHYCDNIYIYDDRLYILDTSRTMAVYEYRIVEK